LKIKMIVSIITKMTFMTRFKSISLLILTVFFGCASDSEIQEEVIECFTKASMQSFVMEPGECVIIAENPDMQLVLVGFKNHTKTSETYETTITVRLEETNFTWETPHDIQDDPNTEEIKFTKVIVTGINEDTYTIYVDDIEFTETETQLIFHRATLRVDHSIN